MTIKKAQRYSQYQVEPTRKYSRCIIAQNQEENNMIKGIVRPVDDLGRLVIPKEMRKALKIKEKDQVDIYLKDGVICIESFKLQCVCCGSADEDKLIVIDGVHMCPDCIEKFSKGVK